MSTARKAEVLEKVATSTAPTLQVLRGLGVPSVGLQQNGTVSVTERSGWIELLPEGVVR